jgi:hypothetical protein
VPTLVREILANNERVRIKVRGMAIGNGCVGTSVLCLADGDIWWRALALRGHAQVSEHTFEKFDDKCGASLRKGIATEECKIMSQALEKEAGYFYEYNLYSECWYDPSINPDGLKDPKQLASSKACIQDNKCSGDAEIKAYVDLPNVRRALNVPGDSKYWSSDNGEGFEYQFTEQDLRPFFVQIALRHPYIRTMIYSGDADVSVSVFATQNWTRSLGLREIESWRPWTLDGKAEVVGYVTRYDGEFDVVTIRGSGHFVPQYKPRAALEMIDRYLSWKPLKRYEMIPPKPQHHHGSANDVNLTDAGHVLMFWAVIGCCIVWSIWFARRVYLGRNGYTSMESRS